MYDWNRLALAGSLAALSMAWTAAHAAPALNPEVLVKAIKEIGPEGAGNAEASKAWRALIESGPDALPAILTAFDGADARMINWLQTAADAIATRP